MSQPSKFFVCQSAHIKTLLFEKDARYSRSKGFFECSGNLYEPVKNVQPSMKRLVWKIRHFREAWKELRSLKFDINTYFSYLISDKRLERRH